MSSYYKYGTNLGDRTYFTSTITRGKATKRYFSNVESEIYFGDVDMKDICKFDFAVEERVLPIYGYNCFYASEIVSGQRLIQGQFVVNFTNRNQILNVLSSIDDSIYNHSYTPPYVPGGGRDHAIYDKNFDIMIGYGYYGLTNETYNATCQTIVGAKISGMQKVMDTTGQPLLEVYNFVAKDFVEENIKQKSTSSNNNNEKEKNKSNKPDDLKYVCSDIYNSTEVASNTKYVTKHKSCIHLIHNLTYDGECHITFNVQGGNNEKIKIKSGTVTVTQRLNSKVTLPKFKLKDTVGATAQINLSKKYDDVFLKAKKNKNKKVKCTLSYKANINGEEMSITHEDAYIHL